MKNFYYCEFEVLDHIIFSQTCFLNGIDIKLISTRSAANGHPTVRVGHFNKMYLKDFLIRELDEDLGPYIYTE